MLEFFKIISPFIADWATFFAAVAALLTLREMHRQRKHSYKPDIVPVELIFDGHFQSAVFCDWIEYKEECDKNDTLSSPDIEISLFNLGNGAAKNITLTWDFAFKPFIKNLNSINKEAQTNIEIDDSDFLLQFKESEDMKAAVNLKPSLNQRKDYILPTSIEKSALKVRVPSAYTWLVSNYFYLRFKILHEDLKFQIPSLKLKLEYSDIGNNKYKSEFAFDVGLIFFSDSKPMPDFRATLNYRLLK